MGERGRELKEKEERANVNLAGAELNIKLIKPSS
jgi:hypothetical protein